MIEQLHLLKPSRPCHLASPLPDRIVGTSQSGGCTSCSYFDRRPLSRYRRASTPKQTQWQRDEAGGKPTEHRTHQVGGGLSAAKLSVIALKADIWPINLMVQLCLNSTLRYIVTKQ